MLRIKKSPTIVVIVYHSINTIQEDRIRAANIITPESFEAQIQYLASSASIIPLEEYLDHRERGIPLSEKKVVVTFDDGYKDNLTTAAPVLQKYAVPATFFIATNYIGTGTIKWEDRLHCICSRAATEVLSLDLPTGNLALPLGSKEDKSRAIDYLVSLLSHLSQGEREQVLEQVFQTLKADCRDQEEVMMTWDDVRELAHTPGFAIGSHSAAHQHLTRITPNEVAFEISNSKTLLERELNAPVSLFSYPYGDYDQAVIQAVKEAGYSGAVTLDYGKNNIQSSPYRLKRVQVPDQVGPKFRWGLWLRSSRVGNLLKHSYNAVYHPAGISVRQRQPREQKG